MIKEKYYDILRTNIEKFADTVQEKYSLDKSIILFYFLFGKIPKEKSILKNNYIYLFDNSAKEIIEIDKNIGEIKIL
jgi:hypothetical protein